MDRPAKNVDIEIDGLVDRCQEESIIMSGKSYFKWPPEAGAAPRMKRLRPIKLTSAPYSVCA